MAQKRRTPACGAPGSWDERSEDGTREYCTAWRRWAHKADVRYLTERQALAVALVQAGIAPTPEAALRPLDAGQGAA